MKLNRLIKLDTNEIDKGFQKLRTFVSAKFFLYLNKLFECVKGKIFKSKTIS